MARVEGKVLFMITSPRTPAKMIPEIDLLAKNFEGEEWNPTSQEEFMDILREENFFNGIGAKDPAFSARDRINRGPKALGFVSLSPVIRLTPAGKELINSRYTTEIFLRQLLKFQVPSPFHIPTDKAANFWCKPYLEIFRLIRHFGTLKFDELWLFGMQLVDYREFDNIVAKIEKFRQEKAKNRGSYNIFRGNYLMKECASIYKDDIANGETKTRESNDASKKKFLTTKGRNMRDYADACQRYLRATGIINVSAGRSMSIAPDKVDDVDFFLKNTDREPCFIDNKASYQIYLYDTTKPVLLTDDRTKLVERIESNFGLMVAEDIPTNKLKEILIDKTNERKEKFIFNEVQEIKDYKYYDDIQQSFDSLKSKDCFDPSLQFEWNTWRAMTMLDGGNIKANLKFDDSGKPLSTAQGNMADIVCDYGTFNVIVEVTMASGQKQYEMEGEPVMRHLGKLRKETNKETYCFFIAPTINQNCVIYFYNLYRINLPMYGGTCTILPLSLDVFRKMVQDSYKASYTPKPYHVENLCKEAERLAKDINDPSNWYEKLTNTALNWLDIPAQNNQYTTAAKRLPTNTNH